MQPYNVKVITFPDLSKQYRVYSRDVYYKGKSKNGIPRYKNPFNDDWTREITGDLHEYFDHILDVSMKRTKGKVYNYARCNEWDWFVTFTFSPEKVDRYDYECCSKRLSNWLNNLRKSCPDLSYLVVPEMHKDGAYHFHGLFAGLPQEQVEWTGKYVIKRFSRGGRSMFKKTKDKIYKFSKYRYGWMTATRVKSHERVTSYITKYITKELCNTSSGRRRYWASRNLFLPMEEVFNLDHDDRFVLSGELSKEAKYKKTCTISYDLEVTQTVQIYDL